MKEQKKKEQKVEETNCRAPPPAGERWQKLEKERAGKERKKNKNTTNYL